MKALSRRLKQLEERFGPAVESEETRYLKLRLEAARLRSGLLPIPPERRAGLRGMSVPSILNSSRHVASDGADTNLE